MTDWTEYDEAVAWCAERGYTGRERDLCLPENLSAGTLASIHYDRDAFARRVRDKVREEEHHG